MSQTIGIGTAAAITIRIGTAAITIRIGEDMDGGTAGDTDPNKISWTQFASKRRGGGASPRDVAGLVFVGDRR